MILALFASCNQFSRFKAIETGGEFAEFDDGHLEFACKIFGGHVGLGCIIL